MVYVILGLLMIRKLTIYEIRGILEGKISPFYSGSYGSIQNAIKKLLANGHITFEERIENGRNKKIYSIKAEGEIEFYKWLEDDIHVSNLKDNAVTKVFFFGFLNKEKQILIIERYIKSLKASSNECNDYYDESLKKDIPAKLKEIAKFQFKTLEFGIGKIDFEIKWYQKILEDLRGDIV